MVNIRNITLIEDIINLLYPRICAGCNEPLIKGENNICLKCLYELHRTNFHNERDNIIEQIFWGRVMVKYATAYCFYHKESRLQQMIFKLKYHGQKEIGFELGYEFGVELKQSVFNEVDLIVPVPLHPKKEKKRGYNQSEQIAMGMSKAMDKPVNTQTLIRTVATSSQTKKNKYERWKNVENIFTLTNTYTFINKHILLVDDVITTGSTLEACIHALLTVEGITVSVATLGTAKD